MSSPERTLFHYYSAVTSLRVSTATYLAR